MRKQISILFVGAVQAIVLQAAAAPVPTQAPTQKSILADGVLRKKASQKKGNQYIQDGIVYGGRNGVGYSLMDIRRFYSAKDRIERVILEVGDEQGLPSRQLSYFQFNLNSKLKRLDIDLAQMRGASMTQAKVAELFKTSPFVKSVKLNYDPEDKSIIMQVFLKQDIEMEVFEIPAQKKFSRIALDMRKVR